MTYYADALEVLEAMEFDLYCAERDWVENYHRDDLLTLAQAVYLSQHHRVGFLGADDQALTLFEHEYRRWLLELGMAPRCKGGVLHELTPSLYTYRPPAEYLFQRAIAFYERVLEEGMRPREMMWQAEWGSRIALRCEALVEHRGKRTTLARIYCPKGVFRDVMHLKSALTRLLFSTNEQLHSGQYISAEQLSEYDHQAQCYIDRLWGG